MRRSLDIVCTTDEAGSAIGRAIADDREFAEHAAIWPEDVSRRDFLTLMSASLALAGVSGCSTKQPAEVIVPYVRKPEQITPGKPLYYATAMPMAGSSIGVLVQSHQGRPTKVEGNPLHPASKGATDAFAQASVLSLYDPDRSQALRFLDRIRGWNEALAELQKLMAKKGGLRETKGKGFRILSETVTSPTLAAQRDELLKTFPEARWHEYEPANTGSNYAGTKLAFGKSLDVRYRLSNAKVVLTLDADPFNSGPGHLLYAREFAERRRKLNPAEMNRFYAIESASAPSAMRADHRLPVKASQVEQIARVLAAELGILNSRTESPQPFDKWVKVAAQDLRANTGQCVVIPGDFQPAAVHALAHAINVKLENVGKTLEFTAPVNGDQPEPIQSLELLCKEMESGQVQVLLILGGNPVLTVPSDLNFAEKLGKVPLRIRLGLYDDETSRLCQWHVPEAHYLESWGDTRAFDGTCTIIQPLIAPLYGGRSAYEVIATFSDKATRPTHDIIRDYWQQYHKAKKIEESFDRFWRRSLHDGIVVGTALEAQSVTLRDGWANEIGTVANNSETELVLRLDPTVHDGRFANNGWLQELPKPLTKLTWDNAAIISPNTAKTLGVKATFGPHGGAHGEYITELVNLSFEQDGRAYKLDDVPVMILPGAPDGVVTLHFGYGRTAGGKVGLGKGVDAYQLLTTKGRFFTRGLKVAKTGKPYTLASTANDFMFQGENAWKRGTVREATLAEFQRDPRFATNQFEHHVGPLPPVAGFLKSDGDKPPVVGDKPLDLYPGFKYDGYKWGMVVDLNACVGCGGCVVACQSENSIPVVGKDQVTRGRAMHWLRIDQYFHGDPSNSETISAAYQPLMCVHCENAPCEVVCPVEATSHSTDGLNEMTYNRCVGTRYCSNNCPYKVRRFNFLKYSDFATESLKLQRNPSVTVRSRGVMEKCTFCVQRIRHAEIEAKNLDRYGIDPNRPSLAFIRDGDVVTACQAACPTQAIVFGDMNDLVSHGGKGSTVAQLKVDPRDYGLLSELNTRPRLTHLAAVRNPNPALEPEAKRHG